MLIISVLSGVFLFWGISRHKSSLDKSILDTTGKAQKIFAQIIRNTNLIYDFQINNILKDKEIIDAFNQRDRGALYRATLPAHKALKKENPNYSNMHFHLPDGHSFLRMHKPEEFGDDMLKLRPIITHTHETYKTEAGYEIGKHGLFYRVVKPVFIDKRYIGALEVGIRVNEVAVNIEEVLNVQVARYISASLVNKDYKNSARHEIIYDEFIVNPYGNAQLFRPVVQSYDFKQQDSIFVENNKKHYIVFSAGKLNNFEGRLVARFLVMQDITDELHDYQVYVIKSVILTIVLIISAFLILYFSFGSMINEIINLNIGLEKKVRERTRQLEDASFKLMASNAELDQIFNTAADGMRVIGVDSLVIRVNDKFTDFTGLHKDQLENKLCYECFHGPYCFTDECTLKRILQGESFIELDVKKQTAKDGEKSFLLTATPFKSTDGKILGVVENFKDMTERNNTFNTVKEKEEYLNAVMSTVQAGVIVAGYENQRIIDVNPYAEALIGAEKKVLIDQPAAIFFGYETEDDIGGPKAVINLTSGDCLLVPVNHSERHIRLKTASVFIRGERYKVISFTDITDVKRLLENQAVDIMKSKGIMTLINRDPFCYIDLPSDKRLYCCSISVPCNAEGGDHLFINNLPANGRGMNARTVISLKDQSGHEVNCILRSIYTDLVHTSSIANNPEFSLGQTIAHLNSQLCHSGYFETDDFFTSINVQIDHDTLKMTWLSTGHPPFLLIRGGRVSSIPEPGSSGCNFPVPFIPDAEFKGDIIQLQGDDQIIFYTDGLTEMPVGNNDEPLSIDELVEITQNLFDDYLNATGRYPAVSITTERLYRYMVALCSDILLSGNRPGSQGNIFPDDVSLIGVEIESKKESKVIINYKTKKTLLDHIDKVFQEIDELCDLTAIYDGNSRVRMVLEEAVLNAWKHGNNMNPQKSITVKWQMKNGLLIEVFDQGNGFDFTARPNPTRAENILLDSGRGLFLISEMADNVSWKEKGTHLIAFFQRSIMKNETVFNSIDPLWTYPKQTDPN